MAKGGRDVQPKPTMVPCHYYPYAFRIMLERLHRDSPRAWCLFRLAALASLAFIIRLGPSSSEAKAYFPFSDLSGQEPFVDAVLVLAE